jgi:hypothetical protein
MVNRGVIAVGGCGGDVERHLSRDWCLLLLKVKGSVNCVPKIWERVMVMVMVMVTRGVIVVGGCDGGVGHHLSSSQCHLLGEVTQNEVNEVQRDQGCLQAQVASAQYSAA